jgi:plasmid maintenance system killer protein
MFGKILNQNNVQRLLLANRFQNLNATKLTRTSLIFTTNNGSNNHLHSKQISSIPKANLEQDYKIIQFNHSTTVENKNDEKWSKLVNSKYNSKINYDTG